MFADVDCFTDHEPVRERTSGVPLVHVLVCSDCVLLVTWALVMYGLFVCWAGSQFACLDRSPVCLLGRITVLSVGPKPNSRVGLEPGRIV